ncbi:hypothetical protein [Streptomyces yangpuensis]|uniref:hypothetical protein n=1 Tax=Streptomyces yangpuensis TaxID=1648182 RepID=UPI0035E1BA43
MARVSLCPGRALCAGGIRLACGPRLGRVFRVSGTALGPRPGRVFRVSGTAFGVARVSLCPGRALCAGGIRLACGPRLGRVFRVSGFGFGLTVRAHSVLQS